MPPRRFKAAAKAPDTSSPTSSAMGSALAERTSTSPGTRRAGSSACSAGSLRKDVGQHSRARALQRCSPPLCGPSAQAHFPLDARRPQEGPQEGRVRWRQHATGERWMEPCACADIAHRFALPPPHRCRDGQGPGVGGRGRGGRVGAEERPEGVVPKGSWGTGAGRAATQSSVRPRAVALHVSGV